MYKIIPFFFSLFLAITPVISMERDFGLQILPDEVASIVVASCANKNALRQTCTRFSEFASRRKNENILLQPQLYLTQEALDRYLLYYGALGNTAIVRNLLDKGANPNATEDNGTTLMHHAVRYGYDDIAKILSGHPALIKYDLSASAIKKPDSFIGIKCNQFGEKLCSGCTSKPEKLLHNVIQQGWYEAVEYLLEHGVSANVKNKKRVSALYCATEKGYINIMKLLISKGAYVNEGQIYNKYGYPMECFVPLRIASEKGHTSAVQLLIDHNADLGKYNGWDIRQAICELGYVQIFKLFLSQRIILINDPVLLFDALKRGRIQMVKILLEKGANPNATQSGNGDGYIPLDFTRRNEDMQKILISYGAKERENCIIQ